MNLTADFWADPVVRVVVGLVVLFVLVLTAYFVVSIFRDYGGEDQQPPEEMLSNLEEMHRRGDISELEYRRITSRFDSNSDAADCGTSSMHKTPTEPEPEESDS